MNDTTLTLIVSGKLWRNSLIMLDNETGTLWSHISGEALDGRFKGEFLETIPSVQTTWTDWIARHPETKVLKKEEEITSSHYERYFRNPDRIGLFNVEWLRDRLPGKSIVYGIARGPFALAITTDRLESDPILNARVGEDSLVVFRTPGGGVRAFISLIDSLNLRFYMAGEEPEIRDAETGSTWDLEKGIGLDGGLGGVALEEVKVLPIFWFAWSNFYPKTDVLD